MILTSCDELAINGIIGKIRPSLIYRGSYTILIYINVDYFDEFIKEKEY